MRAVVRKWGNSAAVRIPSTIMKATKLELDSLVDVREENGRIIIEPLCKNEYYLDRLLAGITAENIHGEVDFGKPVDKEGF